MVKPTQSFGEQAARISLYAPIMAIALALGTLIEPSFAITIAYVNAFLIVTGIVLGTVALVSILRRGRRIPGRAIAGLVLNGVAILPIFAVAWPFFLIGHTKGQIIGHWRTRSNGYNQSTDFTFNQDETFRFTDYVGGVEVSLNGHWAITPDRVISVKIDRVGAGNNATLGNKLVLGAVRTVNDQEMILMTDHGPRAYDRVQ